MRRHKSLSPVEFNDLVRLFETGFDIAGNVRFRFQFLWVDANEGCAGFKSVPRIHYGRQHFPVHLDQLQRLVADLGGHGHNHSAYFFILRIRFVADQRLPGAFHIENVRIIPGDDVDDALKRLCLADVHAPYLCPAMGISKELGVEHVGHYVIASELSSSGCYGVRQPAGNISSTDSLEFRSLTIAACYICHIVASPLFRF